jgi:hypothetical protein
MQIPAWIAAGAMLASIAKADFVPVREARHADGPCHTTVEAAACAALETALPLSTHVEYGGAILHVDGGFCCTRPVTSKRANAIRFRLFVTPDARLAALYHTHPTSVRSASRFSPTDKRVATKVRVRSFLGSDRSGRVRVFDPMTRATAVLNCVGDAALVSANP